MQRRDFLRGIMAAAAALASGVGPASGSIATPSPRNPDDPVMAVYRLLRECRITEIIRRGEHDLKITYVRDGKRKSVGPLFDWIDANAKPKSISVNQVCEHIDVTHLGDPRGFKSMAPVYEVEIEWCVGDMDMCPIFGYREVAL